MALFLRGSAMPGGSRGACPHEPTSGFDALGGAGGGEMQATAGAGGGWNEEASVVQPAYHPPNNPTADLFRWGLSRPVYGDRGATEFCRPLDCKPLSFGEGGGGVFPTRADSSVKVLCMLREAMPEGLLSSDLTIRDRVTRAASAGRVDVLEVKAVFFKTHFLPSCSLILLLFQVFSF